MSWLQLVQIYPPVFPPWPLRAKGRDRSNCPMKRAASRGGTPPRKATKETETQTPEAWVVRSVSVVVTSALCLRPGPAVICREPGIGRGASLGPPAGRDGECSRVWKRLLRDAASLGSLLPNLPLARLRFGLAPPGSGSALSTAVGWAGRQRDSAVLSAGELPAA